MSQLKQLKNTSWLAPNGNVNVDIPMIDINIDLNSENCVHEHAEVNTEEKVLNPMTIAASHTNYTLI